MIPVYAAVISAITSAISWFVLDSLSKKREDKTRRRELTLRHLQRQIEELYGPLLGLIQQTRIVYQVAVSKLPHTPEGRTDQQCFSSSDAAVWQYFVETYFFPLNSQITDLLRTKLYLLDSQVMPESFHHFLEHSAQFECLHKLWKEKGIDSSSVRGIGWPKNFEHDVEETLKSLMERYKREMAIMRSSKL